MALLIIDGKEFELVEGSSIQDVCEDVGIPFACQSGVCGTCQVEVIEGEDNLSELTEMEQELGMDKQNRFACQCKINKGRVVLKY